VALKRVTLFNFFGFKVKADASWFFLAVLISWTMATKVYPGIMPGQTVNIYQWMGVGTVAGLIFSIIAHEAAHAVIAEYYHMPIANITLFIFGGVAEMKGEPSHPKGEFFMAISGPVMSCLMGLFFYADANLYQKYVADDGTRHVLEYLGHINLLIAALNMVPAFPLDGGRALRAIIWHYKNNLVIATRIASEAGAVFAYGVIAYSCYTIIYHDDLISGMWIGVLGLFIHSSGAYAVRQMESRSLLGTEKVSRFLHNQIISVSPELLITDLVDHYINRHYQKSFPVIDREQLVGIITLQGVLALDRHKWHWLHVASVMQPLSSANVVTPDTNAADALEMMQKKGIEQLLVADQEKFLGVINFRDLASYLAITMKIDHNKPVEKSRTAY
jgi:Zn-dependent protease/predicted transcriptional regulator